MILDTETRPKQPATPLDHLPSMVVDARDVDTAARLALAHHIDNRPDPPPAGTSFGLIVITPMPDLPDDPHHDLDNDAVLHHVDCRLLADRRHPPLKIPPATGATATERPAVYARVARLVDRPAVLYAACARPQRVMPVRPSR